jgi:hypothetical protein
MPQTHRYSRIDARHLPRRAVIMAVVLNVVGNLSVQRSIHNRKGIVDPSIINLQTIAAAL